VGGACCFGGNSSDTPSSSAPLPRPVARLGRCRRLRAAQGSFALPRVIVLLAYSVTNRDSFANITAKWYPEVRRQKKGQPHALILVATQVDRRTDPGTLARLEERNDHAVSWEEGNQCGRDIGAVAFVETSALTGEGLAALLHAGRPGCAATQAVHSNETSRVMHVAVTRGTIVVTSCTQEKKSRKGILILFARTRSLLRFFVSVGCVQNHNFVRLNSLFYACACAEGEIFLEILLLRGALLLGRRIPAINLHKAKDRRKKPPGRRFVKGAS
jgi:hypothetical protein